MRRKMKTRIWINLGGKFKKSRSFKEIMLCCCRDPLGK
jgi:hypothetical protein